MSHEFWDKVYDSETYIYGTEVNDYIKEKFKVFPKNAELLEIACGEGRNACYLADYGMKVTAIDISGKGISKLNKLAEEKNLLITGIEADFLTYPFEKKFDVILCTFFHLPKEERTFFYNKVKS
ncbi:MAG: class I SAM-dependent methyltransferase, partial [Leptospiraceae bacterium]|nr:class I SAM-dependent methyltransferase [Leptospiraceae bacterium]